MRLALFHSGGDPASPALWSGTPTGLTRGLESHGVEVIHLVAAPTGVRRRVHRLGAHILTLRDPNVGRFRGMVADRNFLARRARAQVLRHAISTAGALDGVVAMGTDAVDLGSLQLMHMPPIVTYEDATLLQMWDHADSDTRLLDPPNRYVREWVRTQRNSSLTAAAVAVSTEWAGRSFIEDYGVPAEQVHVIGMGHRPRRAGTRLGIDPAKPIFLFVGIDWTRKNGDAVVRAFARVRATLPGASLHLVGEHPHIDLPGVTDHGLLRRDDPVDQALLDNLYETSTAFVLPSLFDPSPISYLEAASAGLPVIATDQGGAGGMLGSGAIVVDPHSDEGLYLAMLQLADEGEANRRGLAAREQAAQSTWAGVAARMLAVFEELRGPTTDLGGGTH